MIGESLSPWAWRVLPALLLIGPLTSALAAGSLAIVKLPEPTPRFAALMGKLVPQAMGENVVCVVNGGRRWRRSFLRCHLVICSTF